MPDGVRRHVELRATDVFGALAVGLFIIGRSNGLFR